VTFRPAASGHYRANPLPGTKEAILNSSTDVVIVGARCAGAPLAVLLAREGVEVTVVEQVEFPRDTLSTHIFEADALAFLDRLGLAERLRETGAPFVRRVDNRTEDLHVVLDWPQEPGDIGGLAAIRRFVLDPILADTAKEAGAEMHMGTKVTGLLEDSGRVGGVRVSGPSGEAELRARLVVAADGRNSTVARLCGSRKYNLTSNERALYYGYFEGAEPGPDPTFVFHRWANRLVLGCPADSGLYLALVLPEAAELDRFKGDRERSFMEHVLSCEPVARAVRGAKRVGKLQGAVRWEGFFREPSGPGWVLTGDAGHFKDPTAGRGIGDAFGQTEALAPVIANGLRASNDALDHALGDWGRWRDDDYAEHYWFATEMGRGGTLTAVTPEFARRLHERGQLQQLLDIQNHRVKPSQVLTPARLVGTVARLMTRRDGHRGQVLRDTGSLLARQLRYRWLTRRPAYAGTGGDAGPTEVE
jgi:flavin-dependent dehydrogenase